MTDSTQEHATGGVRRVLPRPRPRLASSSTCLALSIVCGLSRPIAVWRGYVAAAAGELLRGLTIEVDRQRILGRFDSSFSRQEDDQ